MDIQKEFEDWYKDHHHEEIGSFDDENYTSSYQHTLWVGWQAAKASVVPEGFVLMPKEPTLKLSVAYKKNSIAPISSLSVRGYKGMVQEVLEANKRLEVTK